ncbi:transposase [Egicoccus halophilus]|uniref:transposase n=1 Tax=Egicoccus halophilus TaxID=1670830 RepID=UPI001030E5E1
MGHDNERRQPRPRRKFSEEFKRDAVDLVATTGRPVAEVAAELGSTTPRSAIGSAATTTSRPTASA